MNEKAQPNNYKIMGNQVLVLAISKTLVVIISMIIAMLLSRLLSLEEYGTYSQILIVVNILITVFALGLPNSINFFLARANKLEEQQQFVSVYYTIITMLSVLIGLLIIIIMPILVSYFDNPFLSGFLYVLAILPWTKLILTSIENILVVYQKTNVLIYFRVIHSIFLVLTVISVKLFDISFTTYMSIFVIVEIAFALAAYVIVKNIIKKIKLFVEVNYVKTILKFSLPIGLASVVGILKKEFDKLMIGGFYDTEKLAIYTNAAKELPVTVIAVSLIAILMPQLVRLFKNNQKNKAIDLWKVSVSLSFFFISFFAISIFVFAPEAMTLLYSEKYISGVSVFRIYTLILLFRCTYFGIILNSIGKTKLILYSSVLVLFLNVILNFILLYTIGFIGPAISTLIATLISATTQLILTSKAINIPLKEIFPWTNIIKFTTINITLGIVFYFLNSFISIDINYGEIIVAVFLGLIWGLIYLFLNFKYVKKYYNILRA